MSQKLAAIYKLFDEVPARTVGGARLTSGAGASYNLGGGGGGVGWCDGAG